MLATAYGRPAASATGSSLASRSWTPKATGALPILAGTLPGGARPSKAGPVPQQSPAPFGAALGIHFVRMGLKEPRRCPDSANAPPREVEEQPGA